ncbi:hypothetical protein Pfo_023918 [Paulownia fortunei]|nr:hypothetical protein Pfo_023918 [Paulownia fortunei]
MTNGKAKKEVKEEIKKEEEIEDEEEEEEEEQEQDGVSVHSPCKINSSSLRKEKSEVELELRLLEALEIYPPLNYELRLFLAKRSADWLCWCFLLLSSFLMNFLLLIPGVHRHFFQSSIYCRRCSEVAGAFLQLGNGGMLFPLKPDDEDAEFLTQEEDFRLPQSYFVEEET